MCALRTTQCQLRLSCLQQTSPVISSLQPVTQYMEPTVLSSVPSATGEFDLRSVRINLKIRDAIAAAFLSLKCRRHLRKMNNSIRASSAIPFRYPLALHFTSRNEVMEVRSRGPALPFIPDHSYPACHPKHTGPHQGACLSHIDQHHSQHSSLLQAH